MSMKTLTITFFLTMIFSTAGLTSPHPQPHLLPNHNDVDRILEGVARNLPKQDISFMLQREWNQVCDRDISCKWEGNRCTYKSNSVMRFHCETTTKNWADIVIKARSFMR